MFTVSRGRGSSDESRLDTTNKCSISEVSNSELRVMSLEYSLLLSSSSKLSSVMMSEKPTMALSGVRISWHMELMKALFIFSLSSAFRCNRCRVFFIRFSFFKL